MATATYFQEGKVIDYANSSGSTIAYGEITVINDFVGVAGASIADGETGSMYIVGVFEMPAKSSDTFSLGDIVYWDAVNSQITATREDNAYVGIVIAAKASGATVAYVKLGREVVDTDRSMISKTNSSIAIADASGTTQVATITLKDMNNNALTTARGLRAYMCTDENGLTKSSAGAHTGVTVSTGTSLLVNAAKLDWDLLTNASGVAGLTFDNGSGSGSYADRIAVIIPHTGEIIVSDVLAVPNA